MASREHPKKLPENTLSIAAVSVGFFDKAALHSFRMVAIWSAYFSVMNSSEPARALSSVASIGNSAR